MPKLLSFVILSLLGCGGNASGPRNQAPTQPAEYHLGAEDIVEVSVWKEPGLSTVAPVRPDGKITVPVAGELVAEGKTTRQLEKEITARLKALMASPVVSVVVKEIHSSRVYVVGEVANPGAFPLRGRLTVMQAIALAGGLTEFADADDITIFRRTPDGKEQHFGFDYGHASAQGGAPILIPGDTVVVK